MVCVCVCGLRQGLTMFPGLVSFCVTDVIHLLMNGSNMHTWEWTEDLKTMELKTVKRNYQISLKKKISTLLLAGQQSTGVPGRKPPSKEERKTQHVEFCSLVFQEDYLLRR